LVRAVAVLLVLRHWSRLAELEAVLVLMTPATNRHSLCCVPGSR